MVLGSEELLSSAMVARKREALIGPVKHVVGRMSDAVADGPLDDVGARNSRRRRRRFVFAMMVIVVVVVVVVVDDNADGLGNRVVELVWCKEAHSVVAAFEQSHAHARLDDAVLGETARECDGGTRAARHSQVGAACVYLVQVDETLVELMLVDGGLERRGGALRRPLLLDDHEVVALEVDGRLEALVVARVRASDQREPLGDHLAIAQADDECADVDEHVDARLGDALQKRQLAAVAVAAAAAAVRVVILLADVCRRPMLLACVVLFACGGGERRQRFVAVVIGEQVVDDARARVGQLGHLAIGDVGRQENARVVGAAEARRGVHVQIAQVPRGRGQLVLELLGLVDEQAVRQPVVDHGRVATHCRIEHRVLLPRVGHVEARVVAYALVQQHAASYSSSYTSENQEEKKERKFNDLVHLQEIFFRYHQKIKFI